MRPAPRVRKRLLASATVFAVALSTGVAVAASENANGGQGGSHANGNAKPHQSEPAALPVVTTAVPQNTTDENLNNPNAIGNGANVSGPYDGAPDGPSMNGNDNSNSNKPCAGCVGNADDKNPPGQRPNGSDHNAGYECDRNQGVGQGNPAHSPCQPTPATPPLTPPVTPPVTPPATPPARPAAPAAPNPPAAPNAPEAPNPPVVPTVDEPETPVAGVQDEPDEAAAEELPFTGAELGVVAWLGMVLTGLGIAMARRYRGTRGDA